MTKLNLPAMPFYVGDWLKCPEVRSLPLDYRALWFDLLCYMWESTERGVMVKPNGKPYTNDEIVRMVGLDNQNSGIWLTCLLSSGVCSCREIDGAIFSRRMVRDEKIRLIRRETGSKGGNPKLIKSDLDKYIVKDDVILFTEDEKENEKENEKEIKDENGISKYTGFIEKFNLVRKSKFSNKDQKAKRQYSERIKAGYTDDQIFEALQNYMKTKNHIDSNFQYLTPEFITRSDKLEAGINMKIVIRSENETHQQKADPNIPIAKGGYNYD